MTYLEAAEKVLREAGTPLHFKEIARRALEAGLIEPKGKTPEATMGAQLYMSVRRADEKSGEAGTFRPTGRAYFALVATAVATPIDAEIHRQNAKVENDLLEFLKEMHPRELELIVGQLLLAIGFEDVAVTRYVVDGGIDVEGTLTVGGVTKVRTAIQVKRYADKKVSDGTVRELRGSLVAEQRGLIITTSEFTVPAIKEAEAPGKTPISLIDAKRLIDLLVQHQIGVRKTSVSLLKLNLGDLVVEGEGGQGEKSATLWPLPGGQERFFETLLAFLDEIGVKKPTFDEMVAWVLVSYDKVTKQGVVRSYLRAVLYSLGVIDFDGERVVLTEQGARLRQTRDRSYLLTLLEQNVVGVSDLLAFIKSAPAEMPAIYEHLVKTLNLEWKTEHQVRYRLQWLATCGAVEKVGAKWSLRQV
ncbi:MAG: restriction endonuclease [Deltaproteobacteria bacterium]|nr:restriction endonuclease [Deltaproteobacteria bacterium]